MKKRILLLSLSLLSLPISTAKSAEIPHTKDLPTPMLPHAPFSEYIHAARIAATSVAARYDFKSTPANKKSNTCTCHTEAYSMEMGDLGVTLEKDGPLVIACVSLLDLEEKLRIIGPDQLGLISDSGVCPCCGLIDNNSDLVHQYSVDTTKRPFRIPRIKIDGIRLDKKPLEWLEAVKKSPDFKTWTPEHRRAIENMTHIFSHIKTGTKNPSRVAKALQTAYQYTWQCETIPGKINDDGEIVPV